MFILLHILCVLTFASAEIKHISLPQLTNFGSKGHWDYCPKNQFVIGFQLKTERELSALLDDTALNGIKLFCSYIGDKNFNYNITSKVGLWGNWGQEFQCLYPSIGVGLQIRLEEYQGIGDDTAANNLKIYCSDNIILEGDGTHWGHWTKERLCDRKMAICGIRTQVELQTDNDDTSLNSVDFACCDVPDPAESCMPKDRWKYILTCDNKLGNINKTCLFNETGGLSFSLSKSDEAKLYKELGFTISHSYFHLVTRFKNFVSKKTKFNWTNFVPSPENINMNLSVEAQAGQKIHLYRLVGICGFYELNTQIFKTFSYELDPELTHFN